MAVKTTKIMTPEAIKEQLADTMQSREQRVRELVSGMERLFPNKSDLGWSLKINSEPRINVCGNRFFVSSTLSLDYLAEITDYWDSDEKRDKYPFIHKGVKRRSQKWFVASSRLMIMAEEPGIYADVDPLTFGDPYRHGVRLQETQALEIVQGYEAMMKYVRENTIEEPTPNSTARMFVLRP